MNFSGKLLVGVDDSPMARDALNFAALIALRTGATIALAHVVKNESPSVAGWDDYEQGQRSEAEKLFEQAVSNLAGEFQFETHVIVAKSDAQGLIELAEQLDVAAIVVGSSHRGVAGRVLIGSVGERLLHGAGRPVIVTPRGYEVQDHTLQHIAVGYDGGDESKVALAAAVEIARAANTDLKLIAASDPSAFVQMPDMAPAYNPIELQQAHQQGLARSLDDAIAGVQSPPHVAGEVLSGSPAEVLAAAGEDGVDMVVAGSRGYGPVKVVLLGSVSAKLVRSARCPVMVVPRG